MAKMLIYFPLLLTAFVSCTSSNTSPAADDTDVNIATAFVRAALDGDYRKAEYYLWKDSTNEMLFAQQQQNYKSLSAEDKRSYRESSIRLVNGIQHPDDSTTLFWYYHTANPTDTTLLRLVKRNGNWLVDLKSVIKM